MRHCAVIAYKQCLFDIWTFVSCEVCEKVCKMFRIRWNILELANAVDDYDPITAGKIVNACCVLHNIANKTKAPVPPLTPEEALRLQQDEHNLRTELESAIEGQHSQSRRVNQGLLEGRALQQALVNRLCRNA